MKDRPKVLISHRQFYSIHMPKDIGDKILRRGYIGIAWEELGDFNNFIDMPREDILSKYMSIYDVSRMSAITSISTIQRFMRIKKNDIILYPSKSTGKVYICLVVGKYKHDKEIDTDENEGLVNLLPIRRLGAIPRYALSENFRNSLGTLLTVTRVRGEYLKEIRKFLPSSKIFSAVDERILRDKIKENIDETVKKEIFKDIQSDLDKIKWKIRTIMLIYFVLVCALFYVAEDILFDEQELFYPDIEYLLSRFGSFFIKSSPIIFAYQITSKIHKSILEDYKEAKRLKYSDTLLREMSSDNAEKSRGDIINNIFSNYTEEVNNQDNISIGSIRKLISLLKNSK